MIAIENLRKTFASKAERVAAVDDVTFEAKAGELVTLLGPSGCGKTTTLRLVAGLERPDDGDILVNGAVIASGAKGLCLPPEKRNMGLVFQSYAIWPHMTVAENVAYPLKIRHVPDKEVRQRVERMLELTGLDGLAQRPSSHLSGGQQQRVALARSLVYEPDILLLDEPLSNLDAKLRERMRLEIRELQKRLRITAVYVTHDQAEALAISDTIAVMDAGRILAMGTPRDIYARPASRFVADFVGLTNIVRGRLLAAPQADGIAEVEVAFGRVRCRLSGGIGPGDAVDLLLRPESIALSEAAPSASANVWQAAVAGVTFLGEYQDATVTLHDQSLRVRVPPWLELAAGQPVYVELTPQRCCAIPAEQT